MKNLLLVITGESNSGKKTIGNILKSTEGFIELSIDDLTTKTIGEKSFIIVTKENIDRYKAIRKAKRIVDVVFTVTRNNEQKLSTKVEEFTDITIKNSNIVDTMDKFLKNYADALEIYNYWLG